MAPSFFVFRPSEYAPDVTPPPCERNGFVTFGGLNTPTKTGAGVVALWAGLSRAMPGSRLVLLGPTTQDADPRFARLFDDLGIGADRLTFVGKRPRRAHLDLYAQVDVALDPFPFSGHTTTCDALWQGVPAVTLAGRTYAGRMSASTLRQARLPHLVAESPTQYVQIAADLVADASALAASRLGMRDHLRSSPMLDANGFTRGLEAAYRTVWSRWCAEHAAKG